jgi:hypothetical protein
MQLSESSKSLTETSLSNGHNSPNRSAMAKRKMPDTFYKPPLLKTQLFQPSSGSTLPEMASPQHRIIHHSHTNSLPVDTSQLPANNSSNLNPNVQPLGSAASTSNLYDHRMPINQAVNFNSMPSTTVGQSHVKTFSLPVPFDQQQAMASSASFVTSSSSAYVNNQRPGNGFEAGWEAERTPTGQVYYFK